VGGLFAFYGLLRKYAPVDGLVGLSAETFMLLPLAAAYLILLASLGAIAFGTFGWAGNSLIMASGAVTAVPLPKPDARIAPPRAFRNMAGASVVPRELPECFQVLARGIACGARKVYRAPPEQIAAARDLPNGPAEQSTRESLHNPLRRAPAGCAEVPQRQPIQ